MLAQAAVDYKEHEIVVVPSLRAPLDLQGTVVVGDAMQTQRDLSVQIVEAGGDYLWFVKDNQPTLGEDIVQVFTPLAPLPGTSEPAMDFSTARQVDAEHGRLEERVITVSTLLKDYRAWPYLEQVFKLERRVVDSLGRHTHEVRYGGTSLPANVAAAERLLAIARAAWGIENGLHPRRDVTLREDAGQLRRGAGPHVLAARNNAVVGIVLHSGERNLAPTQRRFAYTFDRTLTRFSA